ncbi:Hypothetical predicted protein [Octopus vulgaris]|uniref:Uncharacterized protein n=1 Tax=Octopus vulgaris TaxID=6645 RepID=A0AA36AGS3_OCTVU|nr:Hypothetical predicted protein [Octopus vulgaris]
MDLIFVVGYCMTSKVEFVNCRVTVIDKRNQVAELAGNLPNAILPPQAKEAITVFSMGEKKKQKKSSPKAKDVI